jgi:hypothetical protein
MEIDVSNNLIIHDKETPSHFCVFPLIGSEDHWMPILLNSPDFEPDSEREFLFLHGEDFDEQKNVISDSGINKMILESSIHLYEILVQYLSQSHHNWFFLSKGLNRALHGTKYFYQDWFFKHIIIPYRNELSKYPIYDMIKRKEQLLDDKNEPWIIFPVAQKNLTIPRQDNQNEFYNLISHVFNVNRLALKELNSKWAKVLWKECGLFKLQNLCEYIQSKQNFTAVILEENSKIDKFHWFILFLGYVQKINHNFLDIYKVIPNFNHDFISFENKDIIKGRTLSDFQVNCLKDLGEDLTDKLINRHITTIECQMKMDSKTISMKINSQVEKTIEEHSESENSIDIIVNNLAPIICVTPNDKMKYSE